MTIEKLEKKLIPLKAKLIKHKLYNKINNSKKLCLFMETHVFAVWDFMSLLKKLQQNLTCTSIPWKPSNNPLAARLVNEIVLGEETDLNKKGLILSHFEMYISAMNQVGANTEHITKFVKEINSKNNINNYIISSSIPEYVKDFLIFTFNIINSNKNHEIAAVFTFGREDLIPDMFLKIVKKINSSKKINCDNLIYYLERHIEMDSEEHGPMALKMIKTLCGNDNNKWEEALKCSKDALIHRVKLWDNIEKSLN